MAAKGFVPLSLIVAGLVWTIGCRPALAAPALPKATVEMLRELKLSPSILGDIDKELQVPAEWIEKAKKEGKFVFFVPPTSGQVSTAPFEERYPFIKIEKEMSSTRDRAIKTLVAFKAGRVPGDVLESAGDAIVEFRKSNAMADLRDIPNWRTVVDGLKDPDGLWVAQTASIYCMGYNTKLVKTSDLPKTWDDLLKIPAWRNGNLGLVDRPNNWIVGLWKLKGPEWTTQFMTRMFNDLKPQRRKEGQSATIAILGAGEYHANIPASQSAVFKQAETGSPVSLHCPDPAPSNLSEQMIFNGAPHPYAAKIYVNWTLSTEGQLMRQAFHYAPVHKDLQKKEFIRYGETIAGKQRAFFNINDEINLLPAITPIWQKLWLSKQ
jgi:iron(III) transport system substrate-binding protein